MFSVFKGLIGDWFELFQVAWGQDRIRVSSAHAQLANLERGGQLLYQDHVYTVVEVEDAIKEESRAVRTLRLEREEGHHARSLLFVLVGVAIPQARLDAYVLKDGETKVFDAARTSLEDLNRLGLEPLGGEEYMILNGFRTGLRGGA